MLIEETLKGLISETRFDASWKKVEKLVFTLLSKGFMFSKVCKFL